MTQGQCPPISLGAAWSGTKEATADRAPAAKQDDRLLSAACWAASSSRSCWLSRHGHCDRGCRTRREQTKKRAHSEQKLLNAAFRVSLHPHKDICMSPYFRPLGSSQGISPAKANTFTDVAVQCTEHFTAPDICIETLQERATMQRLGCLDGTQQTSSLSVQDHADSIPKQQHGPFTKRGLSFTASRKATPNRQQILHAWHLEASKTHLNTCILVTDMYVPAVQPVSLLGWQVSLHLPAASCRLQWDGSCGRCRLVPLSCQPSCMKASRLHTQSSTQSCHESCLKRNGLQRRGQCAAVSEKPVALKDFAQQQAPTWPPMRPHR